MNDAPDREVRLKRLRIRCWRRGTKEMDLILGGFADGANGMAAMDDTALDAFEALLEEGDNDLYLWVSGATAMPPKHAPVVEKLRHFHGISG